MQGKRIIGLILSIVLLLTLASCARVEGDEGQSDTKITVTTATDSPTQENTTTTTDMIPAQPVTTTQYETLPTNSSLITFTEDERYTANVFLSNFSEQHAFEQRGFHVDSYQIKDIVEFVYLHCKINDYSKLGYEKVNDMDFYTVSFSVIKERASRFFGITLSDTKLAQAFPAISQASWDGWDGTKTIYSGNDRMYYVAADGARFDYFTTITKAERLENGNLWLDFDIYWLKSEDGSVDRYYYTLTGAQAEREANLTKQATGHAEVSPYSHNGKPSYQLVTYSVTRL